MQIQTFKNSRGELASYDGEHWWYGDDPQCASRIIFALQPASALFPEDGLFKPATIAKARSVFISCLRRVAPKAVPDDDAEKAVLRDAWDAAAKFGAEHQVKATGVPIFDKGLAVIGSADAMIVDGLTQTYYPYCYFPPGYKYGKAQNALARMLYAGLPISCEDDPHGLYATRDLATAVMALVLRERTKWFAEHAEQMPF